VRARARHHDAHVAGGQGSAPHPRDDETMRHAEAREVLVERAPRKPRVEQRTEEHVARDAREGIEVEQERSGSPGPPPAPLLQVRLIRVASAAALNPLSMFTTATFGAQLFSIASSAATPPNDAP